MGAVASLLALAVLVAARGVLRSPWKAGVGWAPPADEVSRFEADVRGASAALAGYPEVLYASSVPNHLLNSIGAESQTRRFFIAQYALAPALIVTAGSRARVFGDFPGPAELQAYAREHDYQVLWTHGGLGVMRPR